MLSRLTIGIVSRMSTYCAAAGVAYGGMYALILICPFLTFDTLNLGVPIVFIGTISGGVAGFILGLVSGSLIARSTNTKELLTINVYGYKHRMQQLSQRVVLGGIVALCLLAGAVTIPQNGWGPWLTWIVVLILIPGLIALLAFRHASRKVTDWVLQNTETLSVQRLRLPGA
jgi:hypothetical protein